MQDFSRWDAQDGNGLAFSALRERAVSAFLRLRALDEDTHKSLRAVSLKVRASPYDLAWDEAVDELSRERDRSYARRYARFQPKSVEAALEGSLGNEGSQEPTFAWEATLWLRAFDFLSEGGFTRAAVRSRAKISGKAPSDVLEDAFHALADGDPEDACNRFLKLTDLAKKDVAFSEDSGLLLWFFVGFSGALASLEKRVPTSWEKRLLGATHRLLPEDPLSCVVSFLLKGVNPYFDEAAHRRVFGAIVQGPRLRGFASRRPQGEGCPFALYDLLVRIAARALSIDLADIAPRNPDATVFRWLKSLADVSLAQPHEQAVFGCFPAGKSAAPSWLRMAEKVEETLGLREPRVSGRGKAKPKDSDVAQKPQLVWRVQVEETGLTVHALEQGWARGKPLPTKAVPLQRLTHEKGRSGYDLNPVDTELLAFIKNGVPEMGVSLAGHREWFLSWSEALPSLARHGGLLYAAAGGPRPLRISLARPMVAACRRRGSLVFEIVATGASQGWCWWWRSATELAVAQLDARARAGFELLRSVEIPEAEAADERLGVFLKSLSTSFDIALDDSGVGGLAVREERRPVVVRVDPSSRTGDASFLVSTFVRVPGSRPGTEGRVAPGSRPASSLEISESGATWSTRDLAWEKALLAELKAFLRWDGTAKPRTDDGDDDHAGARFAALLPSWGALAALLAFLAERGSVFEVEWPEAQKPLVTLLDSVTFAVPESAAGDGGVSAWFQPGEKTKRELEARGLTLARLVEKVKARKDRFVVLEGGGILALSEKVKALLDDLAMVTRSERKAETGTEKSSENKAAAYALSQAHAHAFPNVGAFEDALFADAQKSQHLGRIDELPEALALTLRGYQREGIEWILSRWRLALGCCLADDMGLGKTLQAIGALELVKTEGATDAPALVVCPTSVVGNWSQELARFGKKRVPFVFPSNGRDSFLDALPSKAVVLVSYQTLQMNAAAFAARPWSALVLDEAQMLKNADAKRTAAVAGLRANYKIALSGTPVENRIDEIHSILDVLNPGLFGSAASFRRKYGGGQSADVAAGERKTLARLLRPFLLRRTREEVLVDLPERVEETRLLAMTDAERIRYESYREGAIRFLETSSLRARDRLEVFTWLLRLRQACSHPRNLDEGALERSAKEQELSLLLADNREAGLQTLVFSQFLPTLHSLHALAKEEGHAAFLFVGETPREERDSLIDRFQEGEADVLFMSLRAGGVGVNLTRADCVVHYDPWWNPALESQATARAHRFGRHGPVRVVRLCYSDSVEERMLELHANKRALSEDLLGGTALAYSGTQSADTGLSLEDLRALFAEE